MELTRKHITWAGSGVVIATIAGAITLWETAGGPVPLTKHSETIQTIQEFSEDRYLEHQIKASLETTIEGYLREQEKLAKAK